MTADDAQSFAGGLLQAHGVPAADAVVAASCLVRADLRGVKTHGLLRLPGYLERIRMGLVNPSPLLATKSITPVALQLDGKNGLGFVVATRAMEYSIQMAGEHGIGMVAVRHSTHFGMASLYVLQAIESGMAALVFTNASRAMPPWGGRESLLGTGPLAAGAPGGEQCDFVLDMSPAVAARGKIRLAQRLGERIPAGYALDRDGRPTTDPAAALQGVVLPLGGPKGSGLAMMMDVFAGVLSGSGYAGSVRDQYKDFDEPQDVGHLLIAMKPDLFVTAPEYRKRMDVLVERVHGVPAAEGFTEVVLPGELESRAEDRFRRTGIPYTDSEIAPLDDEAKRAALRPIHTSVLPCGQ